MPIDNTIALQAQGPDFNPLQQALQAAQYRQANLQANQLQQALAAKQAIGQAYANNTRNGVVNQQGVIQQIANNPDAQFGLPEAVTTSQDQQGKATSNASSNLALTTDMVQHITQNMGQLLSKPNPTHQDVVQNLIQAGKQFNIPDDVIAGSIARFPQTDDPEQIKREIDARLQQLQAPAAQANAYQPNPTMVDNGANKTAIDTNTRSNPGIVGTSIPNQLPPGQREAIATDQLQNPYIVQRDANGNITGTRQVPGAYNGSTGVPPNAGPVVLPPGSKEDIGAVASEVDSARKTANNAPVLHDLNRSIYEEAGKGFATGKLGALTQDLASRTGYKLSSTDATDYNMLGKLLERSAAQAAQGMGPHTNAGLESAKAQNGTTGYDATSIRNIAQLNDALVTGSEHYRDGLEKAITAAGGNQLAKRQFDQDWAKNFDPRIMRLQNAAATGDKAEQETVLKSLGGAKSKAAQELAAKAKALNALISQGHL